MEQSRYIPKFMEHDWKALLSSCALWVFRPCSFKNKHDSEVEMATGPQERLWKLLLVSRVHTEHIPAVTGIQRAHRTGRQRKFKILFEIEKASCLLMSTGTNRPVITAQWEVNICCDIYEVTAVHVAWLTLTSPLTMNGWVSQQHILLSTWFLFQMRPCWFNKTTKL